MHQHRDPLGDLSEHLPQRDRHVTAPRTSRPDRLAFVLLMATNRAV